MLRMPCRQATRLLSEAQDRPLALQERWPLQAHLFACQNCRHFEAQLGFLRRAARHHADAPKDDDPAA